MIAPSHPAGGISRASARLQQAVHNNSMGASAVQITFRSLLAVLLTLVAAPAGNQFERKPAGTSETLQNPHHRAAVSESSAAAKQTNTRKSAGVKFSASRECVDGRDIAGFSAR